MWRDTLFYFLFLCRCHAVGAKHEIVILNATMIIAKTDVMTIKAAAALISVKVEKDFI